jgi:hypothetical protein
MPVICPTGQEVFRGPSPAPLYSNPCTGGAVFPAATIAGLLATGEEVTLVAACCVPGSDCVTRRARARDRPTPQECAIAGPAVYPITAPATAPTGPSTTAPDTAPRAASPARPCAFASYEKNDAAIIAATSNFFIAGSLERAPKARDCEIAAAQRRCNGSDCPIQKACGSFPDADRAWSSGF